MQNMLVRSGARQRFTDDYIRVSAGDRVLDVGCGPADILETLPDVEYWGVDHSAHYIEVAQRRFGTKGRFAVMDAAALSGIRDAYYDIVLAIGLLHHLDDEEAKRFLDLCRGLLAPGKRLLTMDPAYTENRGTIERFLMERDRGRNIRAPEGYSALAETCFSSVTTHIRTDFLRLPYTHVILECQC